jgi:hypothetical protein
MEQEKKFEQSNSKQSITIDNMEYDQVWYIYPRRIVGNLEWETHLLTGSVLLSPPSWKVNIKIKKVPEWFIAYLWDVYKFKRKGNTPSPDWSSVETHYKPVVASSDEEYETRKKQIAQKTESITQPTGTALVTTL